MFRFSLNRFLIPIVGQLEFVRLSAFSFPQCEAIITGKYHLAIQCAFVFVLIQIGSNWFQQRERQVIKSPRLLEEIGGFEENKTAVMDSCL